jgi:hypothetical protein
MKLKDCSVAVPSFVCGAIALLAFAAGCTKTQEDRVPVSNPVQPEMRLGLEDGRFVWEVAPLDGIAAETRLVEPAWKPGAQAVEAVWRKDGVVVRTETYELPAMDDFEAQLEKRRRQIRIPFDMPFDGKATVVVDTPGGVRVRNVIQGIPFEKGRHEVEWDGYREDGVLALPGDYTVRIAVHPGLSYEYLGYSACGGDGDLWIPWGPNHTTFVDGLVRGDRVVFSTYFTEGGHSTSMLDASTGKFLSGWSDHWDGANDSLFLVDGSGATNRFYAVRGKKADHSVDFRGYRWDGAGRVGVRVKAELPPTFPVGAARIGPTLYIANSVSGTLDAYELCETNAWTEVLPSGIPSRPLGVVGPICAVDGRIVEAPSTNVFSMSTDGALLYCCEHGADVVRVYDAATGNFVRILGEPGGFAFGPWNANRMIRPASATPDGAGSLWLTETRYSPKRVSKWDLAGGTCVYEKFGPPTYGYPGMGFDPENPTRWMAYHTRWTLDDEKGIDAPAAIVLPNDAPQGGEPRKTNETAPAAAGGSVAPIPIGHLRYTFLHRAGRTFCWGQSGATTLFEVKEDRFHPIAMVSQVHRYLFCTDLRENVPEPLRKAYDAAFPGTPPDQLARTMWNDVRMLFWLDRDRDGVMDAEEFEFGPVKNGVEYWGFHVEGFDFRMPVQIDGGNFLLPFDAGPLEGDSLPAYSLAAALERRIPLAGELPVGNRSLECQAFADRFGRTIGLTLSPYMVGIDPDGTLRWTMYNPWPGVHGSQAASMPKVGELQGLLFSLGAVPYSGTADVFAAMNNHGRIFFLTTDGLYLDELFSDCRVSARNDESLVGGEAFGGMFAYDAVHKQCILQAGGYRRYRIRGIDQVRETRQELAVTPDQILAAEANPPAAAGTYVPPATEVPGRIEWEPPQGKINVVLSRTGDALVLEYRVPDPSPWTNNGTDPFLMFKTGDGIDLQYLDADGLPVRLFASPKAGDPAATQVMKVRHHVPDAEKASARPHGFSSPWRTHTAADVAFPEDIGLSVRTEGWGTVATLSVPLHHFGATVPDPLSADFGVVYGDREGRINLSRSYWANKQTGLVNDVPGEIIPEPAKWGAVRFGTAPADAGSPAPDGPDGAAAPAIGAEAAALRDLGPLVNPGGLVVPAGSGDSNENGPVWDAARQLLYASQGRGRIVAMRLDGTRVATYTLPGAGPFVRFDTMAISDAGDVFVLAGGIQENGRVYRIPADSPDGAEAQTAAERVAAMSPHAHDGAIALVRRDSTVSLLDVTTLQETPFASTKAIDEWPGLDRGDIARYPCMAGWLADGDFAMVVRHHPLFRFKDGEAQVPPTDLFGSREIVIEKGFVCGENFWMACGNTIKLYNARTLAAEPGVVAGGNSGYFLGGVGKEYHEVDVRGICEVGPNLIAVTARNNAAIYVYRYDPATKKATPVRRLGGIVDPMNLVVDPEGYVMCDNVIWAFDQHPLDVPFDSALRMPVRATAMLPDGRVVLVTDAHGQAMEFRSGSLRKGLHIDYNRDRRPYLDDERRPWGQNWTPAPWRCDLAPLAEPAGAWELTAIHHDGVRRVYAFTRDGHPLPENAYRRIDGGEPPDERIFEARDGGLVARVDRDAGTLEILRGGSGAPAVRIALFEGLAAPTRVAMSNGRIVVYESDAQRLRRFRLE